MKRETIIPCLSVTEEKGGIVYGGRQGSEIWLNSLSPALLYFDHVIVRHHINWNNQRADLKEDPAHLVDNIKRRICNIASAGFPLF